MHVAGCIGVCNPVGRKLCEVKDDSFCFVL